MLWGRFTFWWHYRKNRLAQALARRPSQKAVSQRALWAMHRLGMHISVSAADGGELGWQGRFAQAVSHAACGRVQQARVAVAAFRRCPGALDHGAELALALAPFLPMDALQLVEGLQGVSPALLVALRLRNGQVERARELLDTGPVKGAYDPELHLLRTNASGGSPHEQLNRLNAFLQAHGVPPLELRDTGFAPSPINVMPVKWPEPIDGPLVTVLMTTYRTGARAEAAIASVLAQSYRHLELIVVDDASGDDTPGRVRAWTARDDRVRLIELPRNVGTYAAKLIGMAQASGEFVTCHDSDDWSHPEKLSRQVAPLLADARLVCTVSNYLRMQDDGVFYARAVHPLMRMNPSSALFRRKPVLDQAGAWDCVRTGADSEFLARLKLVFGSRAVRKIPQPLSLGSHRPDSLMTASATGYCEAGMSPQRLAYWEAWNRWHIETLARRRKPFMPADVRAAVRHRPFDVPESLRVPPEDVEACWRAVVQR